MENYIQTFGIKEEKKYYCKGIFRLLETEDTEHTKNKLCKFSYGINLSGVDNIGYPVIEPVIVYHKKNTDVEEGDDVLSLKTVLRFKYENFDVIRLFDYYKVLAKFNNLSDETINKIISGDLKDGDEVMVECLKWGHAPHFKDLDKPDWFEVYYDIHNKIKLKI